MSGPLVLSLFPGVDLLGRAFEEEWPEACIVRGPDLIYGSDIRGWHVPHGKFDGIIGGPPCQVFSRMRYVNPRAGQKHGNLIPEFERIVNEATPLWFLMENVPEAPEPQTDSHITRSIVFNNRWAPAAPEQNRERRFTFGYYRFNIYAESILAAFTPEVALFEAQVFERAVTASGGATSVPVKLGGSGKPKRSLAENKYGYRTEDYFRKACRLQGLPEDFLTDAPFTVAGKIHAVGNGVPLATGKTIACAVRRALGLDPATEVAQ